MNVPRRPRGLRTTSELPLLSHRGRNLLRAVAAGRAEMTCSCEPDIYIDGLPCCDQYTSHALARRGLVAPTRPGLPGQRVPARLTEKGLSELGEPKTAA